MVSVRELFLFFFKISATTFGGGIVIVGMIRLEMEKRDDIAEEELTDLLGLAAAVPGPIAVSSAYMLGRYYRGAMGAVAAVLGAVLPPFLAILFVSPFILAYSHLPMVSGFFKGILAGVAAMIAAVVVADVKKTLFERRTNVLAYALVIILLGWLQMNPLVAVASGLALQGVLQWLL